MNLSIRNFRGLRTVVQQKGLPNEECADVQDFRFLPGLMATREGFHKYATTAMDGAITGLYDYRKRTGRFLLSTEGENLHKVSDIGDTTVMVVPGTDDENSNFSTVDQLWAVKHEGGEGVLYLYRTLIKTPVKLNARLHLYRFSKDSPLGGDPEVELTVHEVDPASFQISTVTWNTKPALGAVITTFTPDGNKWYSFSLGSTGAVCIKVTDETHTGAGLNVGSYFASEEYATTALRPFTTRG